MGNVIILVTHKAIVSSVGGLALSFPSVRPFQTLLRVYFCAGGYKGLFIPPENVFGALGIVLVFCFENKYCLMLFILLSLKCTCLLQHIVDDPLNGSLFWFRSNIIGWNNPVNKQPLIATIFFYKPLKSSNLDWNVFMMFVPCGFPGIFFKHRSHKIQPENFPQDLELLRKIRCLELPSSPKWWQVNGDADPVHDGSIWWKNRNI